MLMVRGLPDFSQTLIAARTKNLRISSGEATCGVKAICLYSVLFHSSPTPRMEHIMYDVMEALESQCKTPCRMRSVSCEALGPTDFSDRIDFQAVVNAIVGLVLSGDDHDDREMPNSPYENRCREPRKRCGLYLGKPAFRLRYSST